MATHIPPLSKKCVLHIYTSRPKCVPKLIWKHLFPQVLAKYAVTMATHIPPLSKKCVLHIYTSRPKCLPKLIWKNTFSNFHFKCFVFFHFQNNVPLPWQHTFCHCQKLCLAHLHPKANICAEFHENRSKTEEVVRDARFPPFFAHNIWLPWQHTFCHCQKLCLAHLHPKANICAKFHEKSVKNWGSSSRRKIFPHLLPIICSYHGNTLSTTVEKYVLHIYTPRQTSVPNSMRISQKLRK